MYQNERENSRFEVKKLPVRTSDTVATDFFVLEILDTDSGEVVRLAPFETAHPESRVGQPGNGSSELPYYVDSAVLPEIMGKIISGFAVEKNRDLYVCFHGLMSFKFGQDGSIEYFAREGEENFPHLLAGFRGE
jgi:hypothetical protein